MNDRSPALHLRVSRIALVAVVFLVFCVTPLAGVHVALLSVYAVPLVITVWIFRAGTDVDRDGVRVRSLLASRLVPWSEVAGFTVHSRGRLALARTDGVLLAMPLARLRHLDAIREASGGLMPDEPEPAADAAPRATSKP